MTGIDAELIKKTERVKNETFMDLEQRNESDISGNYSDCYFFII